MITVRSSGNEKSSTGLEELRTMNTNSALRQPASLGWRKKCPPTSDGSAVEVDLDGTALGRASTSKQVLGRVSLDPKSLADRFNGR